MKQHSNVHYVSICLTVYDIAGCLYKHSIRWTGCNWQYQNRFFSSDFISVDIVPIWLCYLHNNTDISSELPLLFVSLFHLYHFESYLQPFYLISLWILIFGVVFKCYFFGVWVSQFFCIFRQVILMHKYFFNFAILWHTQLKTFDFDLMFCNMHK